jgi:hypothetical protein
VDGRHRSRLLLHLLAKCTATTKCIRRLLRSRRPSSRIVLVSYPGASFIAGPVHCWATLRTSCSPSRGAVQTRGGGV